jgi:lysyl-tRNA synthetase class 2
MAKDKESLSRLEKLEQIKKSGKDPYPSSVHKNSNIKDARNKEGEKVTVAGKLFSVRSHGKSAFMDLRDESGSIQLYFKTDVLGEDKYNFIGLLDSGDYIEASGEVFTTRAGEITVKVEDFLLLSKTLLPVPDSWYGLKDVETRYRKRYLDTLINEQVKEALKKRSKIINNLRNFMGKNGFTEVETPVLQMIPGGAAAKPFITHYNILKQDMYLRISPELYLKRMVVGGFEKVFEIGKNFRNEGLSHMHNPEFTMMEFYWAYQDYRGLMEFTQELISTVIKNIKGSLKVEYQGDIIDFAPPYEVISFKDLVLKDCGIDIFEYPDFISLKKEVIKKGIDLDFKSITVWAKLVDELYKKVSRPKIVEPIFLVDHPIELTPLAKAHDDNSRTAQRFQLVCGKGIELVNAYTELNDPLEQEKRFLDQAKMSKQGWDESAMMDRDFVEALKYGLPPTAGWGMGIERFAMLLTNNYSIKEVIPFPTLKNK